VWALVEQLLAELLIGSSQMLVLSRSYDRKMGWIIIGARESISSMLRGSTVSHYTRPESKTNKCGAYRVACRSIMYRVRYQNTIHYKLFL
jgi:hypothetical protein